MKIIQVIARLNQGGTSRWIETLVTGLRDLNHEVILISGSVESNEVEDRCFANLQAIRVPGLGRSVSIINDFKCIFQIRKILKAEKPDILNSHTAKAGALTRLAAVGLNVKVVHTFHGHLLYGYFSTLKTKIYVLIEKILASQTDALISVGKQVCNELAASGIAKKDKFHVIAPGIAITSKRSRSEARNSYSLGADAFVVGWLGRLVQIKRPDLLMNIARALPEVSFLVGGAGELQHTVTTNRISNFKFVGWASPEDFWPACDLALLTSDNEGLPTALIEAAMSEVPVVARNVGSVSEIFENGVGGFLYQESLEAVNLIRSLMEDRSAISMAAREAKAFTDLRFSKELFIQKHINLYESLFR